MIISKNIFSKYFFTNRETYMSLPGPALHLYWKYGQICFHHNIKLTERYTHAPMHSNTLTNIHAHRHILCIQLYYAYIRIHVYKDSVCGVCCLRPYHVESTGSRPITEVKQRRARLVLGWVTAWEYRVL